MVLKGIDVSRWQGKIEWQQVKKDGVEFVMIRGGYGENHVDSRFHENARGANAAGVPMGIYWFSYALNPEMAKKEAGYAVKLARQYQVSWPIAYDFEYDSVDYAEKNGVIITRALATQMAKAFCEEVKKFGYIPMFYANLEYLEEYFDRSQLPYDLWYAQYASTAAVKEKAIWQYSSQGRISGIEGDVDLNYGYKDYGNGEPIQPEPIPEPEGTTLELAAAVMQGKYGVGEARKNALGSRYEEVQNFINHIAWASIDTLVEEVMQGKYGNGRIREIVLGTRYKAVQNRINGAQYYTVRPGDTLWEIAAKYGTTYQKLAQINGIANPDKIYVGQRIKIKL